MSPGDRIQLYLDDKHVGLGYRRFLVIEVGRKWATLLYLPTLHKMRMSIEEIERNQTYREVDINRRVLRRLIKDAARQRKALQLPYSANDVKTALDLLS